MWQNGNKYRSKWWNNKTTRNEIEKTTSVDTMPTACQWVTTLSPYEALRWTNYYWASTVFRPNRFSSAKLWEVLICKFDAIPSKLPELLMFSDQSTDQKYLYEICHSITSGSCTEDLARRNPGKIAHSCWLTTANRIQRFYVSSKKPSPALKMLTIFIVQVLYLYKYHVCVK